MEPLGTFLGFILLGILLCAAISLIAIISSLIAQFLIHSVINIFDFLNCCLPYCFDKICFVCNKIVSEVKKCIFRLLNINNRTVVIPERMITKEFKKCNSYIIVINPNNNIQIGNLYDKTKIVPD